ncbi:MAG: type II secretion system protein, partial [Candidatus Saccharimonadales bacterium]
MIVLAISGVLLFSALTLVGGQQQKTSFTQAMQDVLSQIQSYASQVQAGNYPSLEGQACQIVALGNPSGNRPQLGGPGS